RSHAPSASEIGTKTLGSRPSRGFAAWDSELRARERSARTFRREDVDRVGAPRPTTRPASAWRRSLVSSFSAGTCSMLSRFPSQSQRAGQRPNTIQGETMKVHEMHQQNRQAWNEGAARYAEEVEQDRGM